MAQLDLARTIERIRALRQKTVANGCTEAEALSAAAKVRELLAEHGLNDEAVCFESASVGLGRKRRAPVDGLWNVIGWYCDCVAYLSREHDQSLSVVYHGAHPKPLLAEYLHDCCENALRVAVDREKASGPYRRRRTRRTRSQHLKAFQEGFILALNRKLVSMKGIANTGALTDARRSLESKGVKLSTMAGLKKRESRFNDAAWNGVGAGRKVDLNPGLNGGKGVARIGANQ